MHQFQEYGRVVHLSAGFAAVGLGLLVMLLPKFGVKSVWHRWVGRIYTLLIGAACLLGVPLAYLRNNTYLMILGTITFAVVIQAWLDARAARMAAEAGHIAVSRKRLRWHIILMGASYIGAWSGFFATNQIFGMGELQYFFYVFGPSVVGAVFITRAVLKMDQKFVSR